MKTPIKITICLIMPTGVSEVSFADPLEDAIKARRSFYQVVSFNAGGLFGMAKGDIAYDAKQAQAYADNLKALSQLQNGPMWPKGSDNVAMKGKTRARPEAWTEYPVVKEKSAAWKAAIADLAGVAGTGLEPLRSKIGALGDSCKGCHEKIRAKDF
ncbi:MAG: c-type cytochrome [Hyphomicrobiaceae bacterium]